MNRIINRQHAIHLPTVEYKGKTCLDVKQFEQRTHQIAQLLKLDAPNCRIFPYAVHYNAPQRQYLIESDTAEYILRYWCMLHKLTSIQQQTFFNGLQ